MAGEFQDSGLRLHPARGSSAPMPLEGSSPGEKSNQPWSDTERGGGTGGEEGAQVRKEASVPREAQPGLEEGPAPGQSL